MSEVEVRDLSAESIDRQLGQLRELSAIGPLREDHRVELSFKLESAPEPMASAVFAQAMLGVRHDLHFVVQLPDEDLMMRSLIRSGVASALARRGDYVSYVSEVHDFSGRGLWHTWTPGAHHVMAPMFGADEQGDTLFGPDHAVFVNPHLTTDPHGIASVTPLIRRWLAQVVVPGLDPAQESRCLNPPVFAIDQLVRNVREHAVMPSNRSLVDSVVALEVLSHGPHRHLRVTVLDTGAGVTTTLRPKLAAAHAELTDAELLAELLRGNLPGWDRGRGFGLATIAELIILEEGASLDLWSGGIRVHADTEIDPHTAGAEITGTVVNALFPLLSA